MKLSLRSKLVISSLAVIAVTGMVATVTGVHFIGSGIFREAQERVSLDLKTARLIYEQRLKDIEATLTYTAMRKFAVVEAFKQGNHELLLEGLGAAMKEGRLDFLTLTDGDGNVVIRAGNPNVHGDGVASDEIVGRVLASNQAHRHTQILSGSELARESAGLAEQARMQILPTPRAKPTEREGSTAGMVLKAAVPILDDQTRIGVLYGGVLLNQNNKMVDTIKDNIYQGVQYRGKEIGAATIFQEGLRITTNVPLDTGDRAVGTLVSAEVYDRVIAEGKTWTARAFGVKDWYLAAYAPIENVEGKVIGILGVGIREEKFIDVKTRAFWVFCGITAVGVILAFVIAWTLANRIVTPVKKLKLGVEALDKGDFDFDVSVSTRDEIGVLAESFSRVRRELKETYAKLQGKIEAADKDLKKAYEELRENKDLLVQKEKLASMGQLSAGIAHELNNPLGVILTFSYMLLKNLNADDPLREKIEMIADEARRCGDIVRGLVDFARQSKSSKAPADLGELVEEVVSIMEIKAKEHGVDLNREVQGGLPKITVDRGQVKQMLINLVDNGIDAIGGKGTVAIRVHDAGEEDGLQIEVADTGCGIPEEDLSKLFTPFFTTKEMGKGTGLGLAIAYGVVNMHFGSIMVDSEPGEGTTFSIWLPTTEEKEEASSPGKEKTGQLPRDEKAAGNENKDVYG